MEEPILALSDFDHLLALLTVANFTFGVERFRLFLTQDKADTVATYPNSFSESIEKLAEKGKTQFGKDLSNKLGPIQSRLSSDFEPIVRRMNKASSLLMPFQKICFFILSFYGIVLIAMAAYERAIGFERMNVMLFNLNTLIIAVILLLFFLRKWLPLDRSVGQVVVIVVWVLLGLWLMWMRGGIEPATATDFRANGFCVYPYACVTLALGFVVFLIGSMVIRRYCNKAEAAYKKATSELGGIDELLS